MKSITFVLPSIREEPCYEWFTESLGLQTDISGIQCLNIQFLKIHPNITQPKPTVWSGPSRLTSQDWWSVANARNTGICLCSTEWICFVDDRAVLADGWFSHIETAMNAERPYVLCGSYQKRVGMAVENGRIVNEGATVGDDSRLGSVKKHYIPNGFQPPFLAPGEWTYGCTIAMPLEWAIAVGGFDETCDGLSQEDSMFGHMLRNNGYPIYYEPRMMMIEDRTPGKSGPSVIRRDKGVSPNDKSHALLNMLRTRKTAAHGFDIRQVRNDALAGKPWPAPWGPTHDFFDGQPISEMKP